MCGIAGILSLGGRPPERAELDAMARALVHRGPDSGGSLLGENVGLTMRRLSIIDLEGGAQPVSNEDQSVWIVFNGEIYNYRELRHQMQQKGHRFRTGSDTEVIVHLYEEFGPRCVEWLRGMFAFAVWDERAQTLLLARDRLGIKPLYYTVHDGRLVFASELKAILRLPEIPRDLDWGAVDHYFAAMNTPGAQSIVAGVGKLEPAHLLTAGPGQRVRMKRYWEFQPAPDRSRTEDQLIERLRELLVESVSLHMVSDVPVGAFLSGGVDSSAIVAAMARQRPSVLKTFTIGFKESRYDESEPARRLAAELGSEHHELILEPDIVDVLEDITWHLDEPFGDVSALPTYMVSRLAAEHVKVVLSGDGGDELFGGYDRYLVEQRERRYDRIPRPLRRGIGALAGLLPYGTRGRGFMRHIALDHPERYLDATTLFPTEARERLLRTEVRQKLRGGTTRASETRLLQRTPGHWLTGLQTLDLNFYLPLDILTKIDRMSMAHSIETRVPLLDHVLVEFAGTIPPELNIRGQTQKYLWRRAMEGFLPPAVLQRPKQGFAVPLDHWLRGRLQSFLSEILLSDTTRRRGIFHRPFVERLLECHRRGRELDLQLWSMLSFELWCRLFLDGGARSRGAHPVSEEPLVLQRIPRAQVAGRMSHVAGG